MAQTQLNRVYVQSIDGTGLGVNALNIGTKSMTRSITIGGVGTAGVDPNIIVVDTSGVRINSSTTLGGTTTIPNLFATTAIVSGNTSLQNTSTRNLGVTGNASITNASINKLEVIGHTNLGNTSITNLEVTSGVKFENANLTGTLSVAGLTTLINVNTSSLSVLNNVSIGGNVSVIGNMRSFSLETGNAAVNGTLTVSGKSHLQNTSNSGVLDVAGKTTLGILDVNGQSTLRAGLTVTGAVNVTNTFSASTLSITGETILKNVSLSSLTVSGNTSLNNVSMAGDVDINTFGTGITTIGGASSRTVIVNTSINGVVDINLTGTTTTKIGNTLLGSCTVIGNASINGSVDINAKGVYTTKIGNTEIGSRTVIGNTSINGVVDINTSGTTTTTIGNTTLGSCTVIGNTSMNGSVDINAKGTYITTIGNTEVGSRTVLGNTSMNGSVDINTSSTGNTTIGSATSSTSVKGDLNVTKILTSGYSPSLYNYAPTLFASVTGGNVSASIGPEYEVTLTAATASVSSISAVSLVANKKYILNFNARTSAGTPTVTILGTQFDLSTTNTLFRKVVTAPTTTSTLGIAISGVATNKIIWSLLTIEPYYDMTLGSDLFSIAGELNVSAATPFTDWDPSRMLFTPTLITVGANPRIAVGRNNTSNVSLFVATCEVTSGNANYITSTDGLTWIPTTLPSITNPRGLVYHENLTQFFMITGEAPPRVFVNTTGNATWTVKTTAQYTIATAFTNMIYGNGNLLAFNATASDNIIHSTDGNNWTGTANSPHTIPMSITDMAYGKMTDPANGTFIFVACGTNAFYRNHGAQGENSYLKDNWAPATGSQIGNWAFVGFGNDTFIAVSNDATGKVTRSENAGVNWLTPVFLNEALTSRPIYLENTWFIGSNTGLYVSKDDGLTWTKRVGNTLTRSVFSGSFVDIGTSLSLITKRNQRIDGSNIAPDTITLGLEGSTTTAETMVASKINASAVHATTVNVGTIGYGTSNTVSLAGMVNVSMGIPTTAFTFTPSSVVAQYSRIAYGNNKFVVIGDPGKVFHSSNGTSWTQVTNPTFSGIMRSVVYANDRFMIVTDSSPTNVYTSLNGSAWTQLTYSTGAPNVNLSRCAYGNAVVVAVSSTSTTASVSNTTGTAWTSLLLPITATGIGFGTMSTGLNRNVFIIVGSSGIRRNHVSPPTTASDWTTLIPTVSSGNWAYVGFGNDTFMVTSSDTIGLLTISVDGGKTWSTPTSFGIRLRTPFYYDGEWYIGSDSGFMVSKTNGITWEKKSGPDIFEFAYDGSTLVSVNNNVNLTNQIHVIGVKKARDDGSTIVSDTIMIGREGSTTTIGSDSLIASKITATNASVTNMTVNTMNASTVNVSTIGYGAFNQVSIAGLVNVSMGNPITTFTFTPNSVAAQYSRIAFGNNTFVIIGEPGKVFYSTNGTTWTASTTASSTFVGALRTVVYAKDIFLIVTETPNIYKSTDGNTWTPVVVSGQAPNQIFHPSYGNDSLVGLKPGTAIISASNTPLGWTSWSPITLTGTPTPVLYGTAFGTMLNEANGKNVFLVFGTNVIKRNQIVVINSGDWKDITAPTGTWAYGGFGNDTFVLTSSDTVGLLTLSRDGGITWSTPINFGITLRKPIYFDGEWYIGSDSGFMMVSKNNGLSWQKITAPDVFEFASSMVKLVSVNNGPLASNLIHVIGLKKTRDDGSTIVSDTITIGREGTTTNIDSLLTSKIGFGPSNTLSIAGNVNVSSGGPVTVGYSYTCAFNTLFNPRIGYGNGLFIATGDNKVYSSTDGITWKLSTNLTTGVFRGVAYGNGKFIIVALGQSAALSKTWTSPDGLTWTAVSPDTITALVNVTFGDGVFVAVSDNNGNTAITKNTGTGAWVPITTTGMGPQQFCMFGAMSTGANVFIVGGATGIWRSINKGDTWQAATINPSGIGTIKAGGFGNDIFMVCSFDLPGKLSISRDGGVTWSAPLLFDLYINSIIYVEKNWFIGTETNVILTSNNDGITWRKIEGPSYKVAVYGNSIFAVSMTTFQSAINFKTKRDDGSLITSDAITIGREGTNTTLVGNTVSLAENVTVTAGNPTTLYPFTSFSLPALYTRVAYGNGRFVIIGDTAKAFYSTNGTTWVAATPPNPTFVGSMRSVVYAKDNFMIVTENIPSNVYTSPDGISWTPVTIPGTRPIQNSNRCVYGNNFVIGLTPSASATSVSVSSDTTGTVWGTVNLSVSGYGVGFGAMRDGTNVFIIVGANSIRRNAGTTLGVLTTSGSWAAPTTTQSGSWYYVGFGNDTFMVTSNDANGKLTISRDGGLTWSTPISFGITLSSSIYADGEWFIGSDSGFMMVSRNDGLTWEKRQGPNIFDFVYGNGLIVSVNWTSTATNVTSVIRLIKKREDGSAITSDAITIGREGTAKTIDMTAETINIGTTGGAVTLSGGLTSTAGTTTLGTTSATLLGLYSSNNNSITIGRRTIVSGDVNIIGFGCGGNGGITESITSDSTGNDSTLHAARIKCVSSVNQPFDYGANGTIHFQVKNGNNWGRGILGEGSYNSTMTINGGSVGVGITTPTALLDVNGALVYVSAAGRSDRRIKTNILDVEDQQALIDLRRLKPKTYTYKDTEKRGHERVYGFIAQEVKEVLNYAGVLTKQSIPNIYEHVDFVNDILTFTTFNTSSLERDASGDIFPRIQVKSICQIDEYLTIIEVLDEHTLKVDTSSWSKDASGQLIGSENPFVYGQEVNDFHTLNKDAIWTVATAALQEVDRQLQAEKQKTAAMQTDYDAKLSNLEARLLALEQKNV